jgi:hypothetical protein
MAEQAKITVNLKEVENLGEAFRSMLIVGGRRVTDRGEQLLKEEAPKVTGNLRLGISSHFDESELRGEVTASAVQRQIGIEGALLHLPSGATREISLRSQPAHDYARDVAEGTGVYGPRGAVIRPRSGKALLIPVGAVPMGENGKPQAYITSGGKVYVMRKFSKGRRANDYPGRAAARLESEVPSILDAVVEEFAEQR